MKNQALKSFTILELTISMLISALVVVVTYTAFDIVYRYYHDFNSQQEKLAKLLELDTRLNMDFYHAEKIIKTSNGIMIKNLSDSITYEINANYFIRKAKRIDTFLVKNSDFQTLFNGQAIYDTTSNASKNMIDEINFNLIFKSKIIKCQYLKTYSSVNLFNQAPYAIN